MKESKITLVLSKANKSRGIANLQLTACQSENQMHQHLNLLAAALDQKLVNERPVSAQIVDEPQIGDKKSNHHPTAVFVSKLPLSFTENDLTTLFEQCGKIVGVRLAVDKKTLESKVCISILPMKMVILLI